MQEKFLTRWWAPAIYPLVLQSWKMVKKIITLKIIIRCFAQLCHRVQPQNAWSLDSWWFSGRCRTLHGMTDSICLCCMLEPAVRMWLSPLVFLRFSWSALTTAVALKRWGLVLAGCAGSDSPSWWAAPQNIAYSFWLDPLKQSSQEFHVFVEALKDVTVRPEFIYKPDMFKFLTVCQECKYK